MNEFQNKYFASRSKQRKSLNERVNAHSAWLPPHLFTPQWIKDIGASTYPLIGVLAITRDWGKNIWKGNQPELAEQVGISDRQIRNQLKRLKKMGLIRIIRHQSSIEIYISDRFLPPQPSPKERKRESEKVIKDFHNDKADWARKFSDMGKAK